MMEILCITSVNNIVFAYCTHPFKRESQFDSSPQTFSHFKINIQWVETTNQSMLLFRMLGERQEFLKSHETLSFVEG